MFANLFRGRWGKRQSEKLTATSPILAAQLHVCQEAIRSCLGMTLFPGQIACAAALLRGSIVEMQTGEGKTLAAVPAAAVLAREGKGVHILTANDYLAERDATWMGPVYEKLGLRVGFVRQSATADERRAAYAADITYLSGTEAGFDYLRDCRAMHQSERAQRGRHAAIIDEADCILIDEARIPMVLAGESTGIAELAQRMAPLAASMQEGLHFERAPAGTSFNLTPFGAAEAERNLGLATLYGDGNEPMLTALLHALQALHLLRRDVDYLVAGTSVVPIDAYKGRASLERRWPAGLHAALEAKENLPVQEPGRVLAAVTMQNYLRQYEFLCGMTGTAKTQADEFARVYDLPVEVIPTHKPVQRQDLPDRLYRNGFDKQTALLQEIREIHSTGRPILVGTTSVMDSEALSGLLPDVPHAVLHAKNEALEAGIIARAGAMGAVTISTNMAGRGVDIQLGEGVAALGGLHVIGTARNSSRRIDNQLRGRAGRQGDPGSSRFFSALDDPLLVSMLEPGETITSQADCEAMQRRAEGRHLDARIFLEKYEAIVEGQRMAMLTAREELLAEQTEQATLTQATLHLEAMDEAWACFLEEVEFVKCNLAFLNLADRDPFSSYLHTLHGLCQQYWGLVEEELQRLQASGQPIRRGATWTYLSVDMPFGTTFEKIARGFARKFRARSLWG